MAQSYSGFPDGFCNLSAKGCDCCCARRFESTWLANDGMEAGKPSTRPSNPNWHRQISGRYGSLIQGRIVGGLGGKLSWTRSPWERISARVLYIDIISSFSWLSDPLPLQQATWSWLLQLYAQGSIQFCLLIPIVARCLWVSHRVDLQTWLFPSIQWNSASESENSPLLS